MFYDVGLVSSFSSNVKLDDYYILDDILYVDFNEYIYSDKNNFIIEEEVVEAFSQSIFANYEVEKIVFLEENAKILEKMKKNVE